MIDYVAIGRKIKMYRKRCYKTQSDLAEELNVSSKYKVLLNAVWQKYH